jgi:hypothetical protein
VAPRIARVLIISGALTLPLGVAACGSDSSSSSTVADSTEQAESEEGHEIVPDSEVTAGLAELEAMGAEVVGATAAGNASAADVDAMYEKWEQFEGTIKQNEVDLYLTMEDNLANLRSAAEDGDAPAATAAMASLTEAAAAYLAKHP